MGGPFAGLGMRQSCFSVPPNFLLLAVRGERGMRLGMGLGREKLRGEEERGGERGKEILNSWKVALVLS